MVIGVDDKSISFAGGNTGGNAEKYIVLKDQCECCCSGFFQFNMTRRSVLADGQLATRQNNKVLNGVSDEAVLNAWFAL